MNIFENLYLTDIIYDNYILLLVVFPVILISIGAFVLKYCGINVKPSKTYKLPKFRRTNEKDGKFYKWKVVEDDEDEIISFMGSKNNKNLYD